MLFKEDIKEDMLDTFYTLLGCRNPGDIISIDNMHKCNDFVKSNISTIRRMFAYNLTCTNQVSDIDRLQTQLFNCILRQNGLHLKRIKRKRKRVNGKIVDVSNYKLESIEQGSDGRFNKECKEVPQRKDPNIKLNYDEKRRLAFFRLVVSLVIKSRLNDKQKNTYAYLLKSTHKEFCEYIENKFENGMSWNNYGQKRGCWVVDHIIPFGRYKEFENLTMDDLMMYVNVQPLWCAANSSKSDNIGSKTEIEHVYHEILKQKTL